MNNRQNGRRRGRGGQQARNGQPGVPDRGSRLDNRARGNAAQLLEKYKSLARDAQMQGDRVNTEYYLQFADHYFRVLSENRSRFEEQQQRVRRDDFRDGYGDEDGAEAAGDQQDGGWDDGERDEAEQPAPRRESRHDGGGRDRDAASRDNQREGNQRESNQREGNQRDTGQRDAGAREQGQRDAAPRDAAPRERTRRNGAAARTGESAEANGGFASAPDFVTAEAAPSRIEIELPPSLGAEPAPVAADEEEAPKPRRRRRPRAETAPAEA